MEVSAVHQNILAEQRRVVAVLPEKSGNIRKFRGNIPGFRGNIRGYQGNIRDAGGISAGCVEISEGFGGISASFRGISETPDLSPGTSAGQRKYPDVKENKGKVGKWEEKEVFVTRHEARAS